MKPGMSHIAGADHLIHVHACMLPCMPSCECILWFCPLVKAALPGRNDSPTTTTLLPPCRCIHHYTVCNAGACALIVCPDVQGVSMAPKDWSDLRSLGFLTVPTRTTQSGQGPTPTAGSGQPGKLTTYVDYRALLKAVGPDMPPFPPSPAATGRDSTHVVGASAPPRTLSPLLIPGGLERPAGSPAGRQQPRLPTRAELHSSMRRLRTRFLDPIITMEQQGGAQGVPANGLVPWGQVEGVLAEASAGGSVDPSQPQEPQPPLEPQDWAALRTLGLLVKTPTTMAVDWQRLMEAVREWGDEGGCFGRCHLLTMQHGLLM